jgi:hypothetical protein
MQALAAGKVNKCNSICTLAVFHCKLLLSWIETVKDSLADELITASFHIYKTNDGNTVDG